MLYLIGLGLNDERDLTLRALDVAKKCECYLELYTSKWNGTIDGLSRMIGKEVILLKRSDLEENAYKLLDRAQHYDVALFVPGDPLAATTHIDLLLEAKKRNIKTEIIHNASIFSAVGELGLQLYKYGKTATIPISENLDNVRDTIKTNKKLGLHTLLLLDLDSEFNLYMSVSDALKILLKNKILTAKSKVIGANVGGEAYYDSVENLIKKQIKTPSVIVIPGKLHFREKDFLDSL